MKLERVTQLYQTITNKLHELKTSKKYSKLRKILKALLTVLLLWILKTRIYDKLLPISKVLEMIKSGSERKVVLGDMIVISCKRVDKNWTHDWLSGPLGMIWRGNYTLASMYPNKP